jgi:hypothetical protein
MVDSAASAEAMSRELDIDVDVRPDGALAERYASSHTLWPAADVLDKSLTAVAGGLLLLLAMHLVRHRRAEAGT